MECEYVGAEPAWTNKISKQVMKVWTAWYEEGRFVGHGFFFITASGSTNVAAI